MSNKVKTTPIYEKSERWVCPRVWIGGVRYPQKSFDTEEEANQYYYKLSVEVAEKNYVNPKDIKKFETVAESWMKGLIDNARIPGKGHRPGSLSAYQNYVAHLIWSFEGIKCDDFGVLMIQEARGNWMKPRAMGGRGLKESVAAKVMRTLGRIIRFGLATNSGFRQDFTKLLEPVKVSSGELTRDRKSVSSLDDFLHRVREDEVLNKSEIRALLATASLLPGRFRIIFMLAIYLGLRVSEILALKWEDFHKPDDNPNGECDLNAGWVTVSSSISTSKVRGMTDGRRVRFFAPKSPRGIRNVEVSPMLTAALREWRLQSGTRTGFVVGEYNGEEPYTNRSWIYRVLQKTVRDAGIAKHISMHRLRHTYASLMLIMGRNLYQVSCYMGHSSPDITLRVYAHWIKDEQVTSRMEDFDRYINGE